MVYLFLSLGPFGNGLAMNSHSRRAARAKLEDRLNFSKW